MRDILIIALVLLSSSVALARPVFGILVYTCFAYLNPNILGWDYARTFPVALIPAVATIIGFLFWTEPKKTLLHKEMRLILGLWGVFTLTTVVAINQSPAWEEYFRISKILGMFVLSTILINSASRLRWLLRVIGLSIGVWALKGGLFVLVRGGNYHIWGPEETWMEGNNAIGLIYSMNVALLFYLQKLEENRWLRRLMWAIILLSYPAIVCTYSRGAWLGLGAVTLLIALRVRYKFLVVAAILVAGIIIQPFLPQNLSKRYKQLENYEDDSSSQSRLWLWQYCYRVAKARPLTGGGFWVYSAETYARYYPEILERFPGKTWVAHSIWFSMLAEHGFLGLGVFVALIASCFLSCKQLRKYGRDHPEASWATVYANLVQTALVPYVVSGTFVSANYYEIFYNLVAVVIVVKHLVHREATAALQDLARERVTQVVPAGAGLLASDKIGTSY